MVPHSLLTGILGKISLLLPATYAMDAFRGLAFMQTGTLNPVLSIFILLVSGILAFALANYLFSWDSRNTARRRRSGIALLVMVPFIVGMFIM